MKSFKEFEKACYDLITTCKHNNYSYDLGVCDDGEPFFKIYAHRHNKMLGSVIFSTIPSGTSYYVSIDIIKEVPYVYIYPKINF